MAAMSEGDGPRWRGANTSEGNKCAAGPVAGLPPMESDRVSEPVRGVAKSAIVSEPLRVFILKNTP